ncbi:MAG: corrinoid protein [Chloroflexi bacterium]|nr:corrinoid protein [Chloroflexota bacterium]
MNEIDEIKQGVMEGEMERVRAGVQAALAAGVPAAAILQDGLIPAMGEVGQLFETGEYFVPEMLIAARAMKTGLEIIKPLLIDSGLEPVGRVAIGTVKGDLHDIGKNLVGMMLEGAGFEIVDLGVDVAPEKFVEAAQSGAQIICLSALLTTTMANMEFTLRALEAAGLRQQVKVIIGGAPVTADFATKIGADGFAPDASQAATLAKTLVK